jgi:hypothetical protein
LATTTVESNEAFIGERCPTPAPARSSGSASANGVIRNDDAVTGQIRGHQRRQAEGRVGQHGLPTFTVHRRNWRHQQSLSALGAVGGAASTAPDFAGGVLPTGEGTLSPVDLEVVTQCLPATRCQLNEGLFKTLTNPSVAALSSGTARKCA